LDPHLILDWGRNLIAKAFACLFRLRSSCFSLTTNTIDGVARPLAWRRMKACVGDGELAIMPHYRLESEAREGAWRWIKNRDRACKWSANHPKPTLVG